MNLLNLFRSAPAELICPRCEKPLAGHDEEACARKISRRFFFQAVSGAAAAAAIAQVLPAVVDVDAAASALGYRAAQSIDAMLVNHLNTLYYEHAALAILRSKFKFKDFSEADYPKINKPSPTLRLRKF